MLHDLPRLNRAVGEALSGKLSGKLEIKIWYFIDVLLLFLVNCGPLWPRCGSLWSVVVRCGPLW